MSERTTAETSGELTAVIGSPREPSAPRPVVDAGARIGRYLVIEELGRGGMGVVLRAYDPKLQREVALKLVHREALNDAVQERLIREARAMARASHPNVVGVFDVELGLEVVTPRGEPSTATGVVIVMEYVRGATLHAWLEEESRSREDIIAAFVQAGSGLAAAHAEGVFHRDFKLTNVLMGSDERIRVVDFGLARAASIREPIESGAHEPSTSFESSTDGEDEALTVAGAIMGTPLYMAPEQHVGGELDARADQFAFCVGLWRALTGRWPYTGRGRVLYNQKVAGPPKWPSDVAAPRSIVAAIRRGLSADPHDRWSSMLALLAELQRDPRRRFRRALIVGTLGCVALGTWGAQSAIRARARLVCSDRGDQIAAIWNAERRAAIAASFDATGVPHAGDTWNRASARIDAHAEAWRSVQHEICERVEVERTWEGALANAARACLDDRLGELSAMLDELAQPDVALIHQAAIASASLPLMRACTDASMLLQQFDAPLDVERRTLRAELARASAALATGRYAAARDQSAALLEWKSTRDDDALRAEVRIVHGGALGKLGKFSEARVAFEKAFIEAGGAGRDDLALRAVAALIFVVGYQLAEHGEALQWERVSRMLLARLGDTAELEVSRLMNNVGALHHSRGAFTDAHAAFEQAARASEALFGPDHLDVGRSLNNLGAVHWALEASDEALRAFERALEIREQALGPYHPDVAATLNNLASVRASMRAFEEAVADHERALAIREMVLGPEHPDVAVSLNNLGAVQRSMGKLEESRASQERALAIREKVLEPLHPDTASTLVNLGSVYYSLGDYEQAQHYFERALMSEKTLGEAHPQVATTCVALGGTLVARGLHEEARPLYERALAARTTTFGPEHPIVARTIVDLAKLDRALGDHAQAVTQLERALAILEKSEGDLSDRADTRWILAQTLRDAGDRVRAYDFARAAREDYASMGAEGEKRLEDIGVFLARAR